LKLVSEDIKKSFSAVFGLKMRGKSCSQSDNIAKKKAAKAEAAKACDFHGLSWQTWG